MTSTPNTPSNGASATASSPSSSSASEYGMTDTQVQKEQGMNIVGTHIVEDENSSANDSNSGQENTGRSTSSCESRSEARDTSYKFSRREELSSKETRAVTKLKLLVFGSLFCSMVAVALVEYFLTSQAEQDGFELLFNDYANKLLGNIGKKVEMTMEASDAFITSVTSYAAHTNQTWPYVVIPDFSVRAEKVRSLCGAVYVNTYHSVEDEQRKEWENFTATVGTEMADEAVEAVAQYNVMDWPVTSNYTGWNVIYDHGELAKENKVCTPQMMTM
jgi:hypothetical protein